jgi:hypothetical protein
MDCDSPRVWLSKVSINDVHEVVYDVIRRCRTIDKEKVIVVNLLLQKEPFVVLLLIESYNSIDTHLLEDIAVFLRMMSESLICITFLDRTHKRHEPSGDDPVEVSILDSFVMLVLLDVECPEVIPLVLYCKLEAL